MKHKRILILGDIHTPFQGNEVIKQAYEFNKKFKADLVICTGDLLDQKAWSRYPKDPEDDGPETEWSKAEAACRELHKLFPKMTILNSNHDRRYIKKAREAGLISKMIRPLEELLPLPGWQWHLGPEPLLVDNIAFFHGDEHQGSVLNKAKLMGRNVVQGHSHKAELHYLSLFDKQVFAMDVGCMVEPSAMAFNYAATSLSKVWTGYAYIEDGVPHLVPKKK